MINLALCKVTTALAKANSKVARTFQPKEDLTPASEYLRMQDGKLRHWAPTTGAATESVHRTRAEVMGTKFYLKNGRAVSDYTWYLEKVNYSGEFVFQQAHCDDGNDPTLKLFGRVTDHKALTGQILYGLRTEGSSKDPTKVVLMDGVDFTKPVNTIIDLTQDGSINLTAVNQGKVVTVSKKLSAERAARPHVFHNGPYNQVNMGGKDEPEGDGTLLWSQNIDWRFGDAPVVVEPTPPVATAPEDPIVAFVKLLDAAEKMDKKAIKDELNRITNLVDKSGLTDEQQAPLYARIKALKKKK